MISRVLQSTLKILLTTIDLMPDDKTLQQRAESWASDALGPDHAHPHACATKFFEDACELAQATGVSEATMLAMVSHEFERGPTRGLRHVVGDTAVALNVVAAKCGIDPQRAAEERLDEFLQNAKDNNLNG